MSRRPTWGSAAVTGLAGFAAGLLVAALLVAGRPDPRPAEVTAPLVSTVSAVPVTVTASVPPATVTSVTTSPPTTTTSVVQVTITPPSPTPTSQALPLTSSRRD
jgi:hypothetical protein